RGVLGGPLGAERGARPAHPAPGRHQGDGRRRRRAAAGAAGLPERTRSCRAMTTPTLLHGPYHAPALRRGDRATCLDLDAEVVITSWTAAPIPWPRCRLPENGGAGSGLLVDEELARAVRRESSLAIQHWWGVSPHTVWSWRRAFGVAQWGTEGS